MFIDHVQKLCINRGISLTKLTEEIGISQSNATGWKKGASPRPGTLKKIADYFNVPVESLLDNNNIPSPSDKMDISMSELIDKENAVLPNNLTEFSESDEIITFNIIGSIAAGYDGAAVETLTGDTVQIPRSLLHGIDPSEFFALRVKGNSMYPRFLEGDCVLIRRMTSVDSGSIAAILYNGDEATLKEVRYISGEDWMELIPANPEYPPKRIVGDDLQNCRVLGKAFKLIRDI